MTQKQLPELSIVIGALREEKRIAKSLDTLALFLKEAGLLYKTELVIVVAEGGDKTKKIVLSKALQFPIFQFIEPGKPVGKGRDIRAGMLAATGELRLFMDADLATPLKFIHEVLGIWKAEAPDVIIGVRSLKLMHNSLLRRMISIIGNLCFRFVAGFYLPDTQCGFKAYSANATNVCFGRMTRLNWSFDMETLTIANLQNLIVRQIHIPDWQDVPGGTFKGSLKDSWQFFKDLVRIYMYRLMKKYN